MGYIAAHEVGSKFKEVAVISTNESSHKTKKGFYRISRLEDTDILVLGGWLDVYLYYYVNKKFEKIVFLPTIHESKPSLPRPDLQHLDLRKLYLHLF